MSNRNKDESLTLRNLARLRCLADRSWAVVEAAGGKATKAQRETARFWSAELFRLRPQILRAHADRWPSEVLAAWLNS